MRRYLLAGVVVLVALGLIGVFSLQLARINVRIGSIDVQPESGAAGTLVTVVGRGWAPGQEVQIQLSRPEAWTEGSVFGVAHSDDQGGFQYSFPFPNEGDWADLPWARVVASVRGVDLRASAPFVVVPPTPTQVAGPLVTDALAATYFPLVYLPPEIIRGIPHVTGQILNLQPISRSSLFAFDLRADGGEIYHVRLSPELVVMRADLPAPTAPGDLVAPSALGLPGLVQISPTFVNMGLAEGKEVTVVGLVDGTDLLAESIATLEGTEPGVVYYRSFLDPVELQYVWELGLEGLYVWVRTELRLAPLLTSDPVEPVLGQYDDQLAVMGGYVLSGGDGLLTDVTVYIKEPRMYVQIYPEREVDVPR